MRVFDIWLEGIKSNTPKGLIDLRRENIGDSDLENLGAALQNNNIVWCVQLSKEYSTFTNKGLESFAENIKLRKEPLAVDTNDYWWNCKFRSIENEKRLEQAVKDGLVSSTLPSDDHSVQNDNSTSDLTDSFEPTISLSLEKESVVKAALVEDEVVQAVSVVEALMDIAEEAEEDVELESIIESVESLSVDASNVNLALENLNTSYQENFATISSNDIKSEKIKSTGFFAKIFNGFTTIKDTFTSLFNHNATKDSHYTENTASKFYVTKDDMSQEDTNALGCVNDID